MADEQEWTERSLYFSEFERLGEQEVRRRLSVGLMVGDNLRYSQDWVSQIDADRDSERVARMEASNAESLRIARSAKNAAWAAAITAMIAIVVSVMTALRSHG